MSVCHDDMKIVRDQQDAAAGLVADAHDQLVERDFAGEVDALQRFVEHEQIGTPGDRARQEGALELAAREPVDLGAREMRYADQLEGGAAFGRRQPPGQAEQALDRQRQGRGDRHALRHVADPQGGGAQHPALVGRMDPDRRLGHRRLARSIGPDQGHDLAAADLEVDIAHQPASGARDADPRKGDQGVGGLTRGGELHLAGDGSRSNVIY